jgi:hypothetical protein
MSPRHCYETWTDCLNSLVDQSLFCGDRKITSHHFKRDRILFYLTVSTLSFTVLIIAAFRVKIEKVACITPCPKPKDEQSNLLISVAMAPMFGCCCLYYNAFIHNSRRNKSSTISQFKKEDVKYSTSLL